MEFLGAISAFFVVVLVFLGAEIEFYGLDF